MKPENQAVIDGIMREVRSLSITQRRTLLRAMENPYFRSMAFHLADADEYVSSRICSYTKALIDARRAITL